MTAPLAALTLLPAPGLQQARPLEGSTPLTT
jgi:hypothetical protein